MITIYKIWIIICIILFIRGVLSRIPKVREKKKADFIAPCRKLKAFINKKGGIKK